MYDDYQEANNKSVDPDYRMPNRLPTAPLIAYVEARGGLDAVFAIDPPRFYKQKRDGSNAYTKEGDNLWHVLFGKVPASGYRWWWIDEFCIEILQVHPCEVYGDAWFEPVPAAQAEVISLDAYKAFRTALAASVRPATRECCKASERELAQADYRFKRVIATRESGIAIRRETLDRHQGIVENQRARHEAHLDLHELADMDSQGCTEWSCMYHGESNRARHQLRLVDAA